MFHLCLWLSIVVSTLTTSLLQAEDKKPLPVIPPMSSPPVSPPIVLPPISPPISLVKPVSRQVFVPWEELGNLLNSPTGHVLLTRDEYNALLKKSQENPESQPLLKGVTLANMDCTGEVNGQQLLLNMKCDLLKPIAGWSQWDFQLRGGVIEEARVGGDMAVLARDPKQLDHYQFFTSQTGKVKLELKISIPLVSQGSDRIASFELPESTSTNLKLTLTEPKEVVANGVTYQPLSHAAGDKATAFEYQMMLGGQKEIQLRFTDHAEKKISDSLVFSHTAYGLEVFPDEVLWRAQVQLRVFGYEIKNLRFRVPNSLEITHVDASGLDAWEMKEDPAAPGVTIIDLKFRQSVAKNQAIRLTGIMTTTVNQQWDVPALKLEQAMSQTGVVLIRYSPTLRVKTLDAVGVRASSGVIPLDQDGGFQSASLQRLLYDIWNPDFRLTMATLPKDQQVQTVVTSIVTLNETAPQWNALIQFQPFFVPLFHLDVVLPDDWVTETIVVNSQIVEYQVVDKSNSLQHLVIKLKQPVSPGSSVNLQIVSNQYRTDWPLKLEPVSFKLPTIKLPQSNITEGSIAIIAPETVEFSAKNLQGLDTDRIGVSGERMGFRFHQFDYQGELILQRAPTMMTAEVTQLQKLRGTNIHSQNSFKVTIEGGGTENLLIELPQAAGTNLRFVALSQCRILEQSSVEQGPDVRLWTLKFDQRLRGVHTFQLTLDIPVDAEGIIKRPHLVLPQAQICTWWLGVESLPAELMTIVTAKDHDGNQLTRIDPLDFPAATMEPDGRLFVAYRSTNAADQLEVRVEKFDRTAVSLAVSKSSTLTTLMDPESGAQHKYHVEFQAAGLQNLRLTFPDQSSTELWSVLVNGTPAEVRKHGADYEIQLRSDSTIPLGSIQTLDVYYQTQHGPQPMKASFGPESHTVEFEERGPQLSGVLGNGESIPVVMLNRGWSLFYPQKYLLLSSQGEFKPASPLRSPRLSDWVELRPEYWDGRGIISKFGLLGLMALIASGIISMPIIGPIETLFRRIVWIFAIGMILLFMLSYFLLPSVQNARSGKPPAASSANPQIYKSTDRVHESELYSDFDADGVSPTAPMPNAVTPAPMEENQPAAVTIPQIQRRRLHDVQVEAEKNVEQKLGELDRYSQDKPAAGKKSSNMSGKNAGGVAAPHGNAPDHSPFNNAPFQPGKGQANSQPQSGMSILAGDDVNQFSTVQQNESEGLRQQNGAVNKQMAAKRDENEYRSRGGLLSVSMQLAATDGRSGHKFFYYGLDADQTPLTLKVQLQERHLLDVQRISMIVLLVALTWFMRNNSPATLLSCLGLAIALPMILMPMVPLGWMMILEGIWEGAMLSLLCVLLRHLYLLLKTGIMHSHIYKMSKVSMMLLGFICLSLPQIALAQEDAGKAKAIITLPYPVSQVAPPTVVIPYQPGQDPTTSNMIYLPREEFLKLWKQAHPEIVPTDNSRQQPILCEMLSVAEIPQENQASVMDTVLIKNRLVFYAFDNEPVLAQLPFLNIAMTSAKLDGKPASIHWNSQTKKSELLLEEKGLHLLEVEYRLAGKINATAGQFTIQHDFCPPGKLSFALPAPDAKITLNQVDNTYHIVQKDGKTSVEIPWGNQPKLDLRWQPRVNTSSTQQIIDVDAMTYIRVSEAGISNQSTFKLQVKQGKLQEQEFRIPSGVRIQSIAGTDIGGWQIETVGDHQMVKAYFRREVTDKTDVTLEVFLTSPAGKLEDVVNVAVIEPWQVTHVMGKVGLVAEEQFQLTALDVQDLQQVSAKNFPMPVDKNKLDAPQSLRLQYSYTRLPYQLKFKYQRKSATLQAELLHSLHITQQKMKLHTIIKLQATGQAISVTALDLPPGFLPINVISPQLNDWFLSDDQTRMFLEFKQPILGSEEIQLTGTFSLTPETKELKLQFPGFSQVTNPQAKVGIWIDPHLDSSIQSVTGWQVYDPHQLPPQIRQHSKLAANFALQKSNANPAEFVLQIQPQMARYHGEIVTMNAVTETSLDLGFLLRWHVQQGALSQLFITGSPELAGRVQFQSPGIQRVAESMKDGKPLWTLTLDKSVSQEFLVTAIASLPPASAEFEVPQLQMLADPAHPQELERQVQYLIMINLSRSLLTQVGQGALEMTGRDQIPFKLPEDLVRQAMEMGCYQQLGKPVKYQLRKINEEEINAATVNVADLKTVLSHDGSWRTVAVYSLKNWSRQFLPVELPANSHILTLTVNQHPVEVVQQKMGDKIITLVPLPTPSAVDLSYPVKLILEGRLPQRIDAGSWWGKDFKLPAPRILTKQDHPTLGVIVGHTQWSVFAPPDMQVDFLNYRQYSNMQQDTDTSSRELYQQSRWNELVILNKAVHITKNSAMSEQQLERARTNLKQLHAELKQDTNALGNNRFAGTNPVEAEKVLSDTISNIQLLDQWDDQPQITRDQTRLGRSLIEGQNTKLYEYNFIPVDKDEKSNVDSMFMLESLDAQSSFGNKSEARRKDSKDRGQLKEEQSRQVDYLNRQNAMPNQSPHALGLQLETIPNVQNPNAPPMVQEKSKASGVPILDPSEGKNAPMFSMDPPSGSLGGGGTGGGDGGMGSGDPRYLRYDTERGRTQNQTGTTHQANWGLEFDLPLNGQQYQFSKVGGDPELTLRFRQGSIWNSMLSWTWSLVFAICTAAIIWMCRRNGTQLSQLRMDGIALCLCSVILCLVSTTYAMIMLGIVLMLTGVLLLSLSTGKMKQV
jgi:hypothetical protein